jgi:hypothetical protein
LKNVCATIALLFLFLTGCASTQTSTETKKDLSSDLVLQQFAAKNNALLLDANGILSNFTIEYQDRLQLNKPVVFNANMDDIYRDKGKIYVEMSYFLDSDFKYILECPQNIYEKISNELISKDSDGYISSFDEYGVLATFSDTEKANFEVSAEQEEETYNFSIENSKLFIVKGTIIDIVKLPINN